MRVSLPAHTRYLFAVVLAVLLGSMLQLSSYMNPDCAWLMDLAARLLRGEQLYRDVSETNPPLIVWLHLIPATVSQLTGASLQLSFVVFVQLLAVLGCAHMLRVNRAYPILNWAYLVVVLIMPANMFGEREHLLLMLTLPFLISLLPANSPSAMAALPAAIGIALKPYFILLPLALIVHRAWQRRSLTCLFHPAYWLLGALIGGYVAWLLLIDTLYVKQVLPDLLAYYHSYRIAPRDLYTELATYSIILLFPFALFAFVRDSALPKSALYALGWLCLAALGTVWWQFKAWGNHWYVFLGCSLLLNSLILTALIPRQQPFINKLTAAFALLACLITLCVSLQVVRSMSEKQWPPQTRERLDLIAQSSAKTSLSLSLDLMASYPHALHASLHTVGRYHHLWFLGGMYRDRVTEKDRAPHYRAPDTMDASERRYFDQVVDDLITHSPDLVIVTERTDYYHPQHDPYPFDFLDYYRQDARFNIAWSRYHAIGKVGDERFYLHQRLTMPSPANSSPQTAPASP